jgi:phosphate-selective porin OprO/OprP
MRLQTAIAGALMGAYGISAHAYDWLNDWPTKLKTDAGYEFGIKGLYQFDSANFSGDTTNPLTGKPLLADATAWRRKEFTILGKTPFGVDFNFSYDYAIFAGVQKRWLDNFVRYTHQDFGAFRLGQFKTPVGWEEAESSSATTFLERSLPVQAATEDRRIGIDWTYTGVPKWILILGYYSGGDLNGDNDGHGPAGHVVFNPILDKNEVVHLGLAVSRESRDTTTDGRNVTTLPSARFRTRPESNLTGTRLIDTGALSKADNIDRFGLEGAWIHGPLLVQGEYLHFNADFTDTKPSYGAGGYYVSAAWMLTGESRDYKNGYVVNVKPSHAYGAFEIAARYSQVDLNDRPVLGGKQHDWTLGANWYLGSHLKFQANYVRAFSSKYSSTAKADLEIDPTVFELRAQVYF